MITPAVKDRVLNDLVNTGIHLTVDINDSEKDYQIPFDFLEIILDQFERKGFIEQEKMLGGAVWVTLTAEAFDFARHGGFTAQEELLQSNLQKLLYEIDVLKKQLAPNHLETANKIAAIGSAITSALGLMIK